MPTPDAILASATTIANDWRSLAAVWHFALALLVMFLLAGRRPSARTLALASAAPLVSVAALAWTAGNPFNGLVFAALAAALLVTALRCSSRPVRIASDVDMVLGSGFIAMGWVYPHFLDATSPVEYVFQAPFGLLPCPTLLVVSGLTMMFGSFDSRAWRSLVAGAALIYGGIGVGVLGVTIDLALIASGVALVWGGPAWRPRRIAEGFGAAAVIFALTANAHAQTQAQEESPAVGAFISATRDYAALHHRIERQLPSLEITSSAETIRRAVEAMANAMRAARPDAKQGDLFTPALASEFRGRIHAALLEHGFTAEDIRFAEWLDGINPSTARLAVNGTFPWAYGSAMFPCLIEALPPLPPELQYRIVGNTLVLIDTHASLIVDLLPHALAESTTELDCGIFRELPKFPR